MIKLAVFDLDKTLLDDEGKLPADFSSYQNKFMQMGVQIAIATARPWKEVKKIFCASFSNLVGICDNGHRIFAGDKYEILHCYEKSEILQLIKYVNQDTDIALVLSGRNHNYVDSISADRFCKHEKMWLIPDALDIEEYMNSNDDICNANFLCFSDTEDMDIAELVGEKVNTVFQKLTTEYNLMPAGYGWISVLPLKGGKHFGLQVLMARMKADFDETMVFGDSENDVPMFSLVCCSYAMQNAEKSVKKSATFITEENNNHGGALKAALAYMQQSL